MVEGQALTGGWDSLVTQRPGTFRPEPFYNHDSDSLTFFISDRESYRERIDPYLTIYRAIDSNEVVGCHVKYVKHVLATVQSFHIGIETKDVTLGLLLMGLPLADDRGGGTPKCLSRNYRETLRPITERAGATRLPQEAVLA